MKLIDRHRYTAQVAKMIGKGLIVALTGQRRVGKSCVMQQLAKHVGLGADSNIIYINKDQEQFSDIDSHEALTAYINQHLVTGKENYLFIDEVQNIPEFEKSLRSFQAQDTCNIMITGSNAHILSSELSTFLSGRCVEYHIQSLSYREFLEFHVLSDSDDSLTQFLDLGGLPQIYRIGLENRDLIDDYLSSVYDTIVLKDVVERENIRNVPLLKTLVRFIADNIGKECSATSIVKYLKSQRLEVSSYMILNYLEYLSNAYIINRVPRYDLHGRRLFETNAKYYFEDLGLRNSLSGHRHSNDIEKLIENAVYLHLKGLGYKIAVGLFRKAEIDFVAEKPHDKIYIQVTESMQSPETRERELRPLRMIRDNYEKIVLSMDRSYIDSYDGIKALNLLDWLLA